MPDSKITALTSISTSTDPANDPLVIVDLSDTSMAATGTTKKVTLNQLLGASGTATLASATITGDLTVDTNVLKVDTTNNRVTVGTTSAYGRLTVGVGSGLQAGTTTNVASGLIDIDYATTGNINTRFSFVNSNGVTNAAIDRIGNPNVNDSGHLAFLTRSGAGSLTERYRIAADGVATWSEVGGVAGTAMTLNATGLVVGAVSALSKLTVAGSNLTTASWGISSIYSTDSMAIDKGGSITFGGAFTGTTVTYFAQISGRKENSTDSDVAGYLALSSRPTGGLTTDRMRVKSNGQIRFIPLAADPSGAEAGDVYYNSTSNKLKCYNGTTWNDLF